MVVLLVQWCVPDLPASLKEQIRREAYITNEIIIAQEAKEATQSRTKQSTLSLFQSTLSEKNKSSDVNEVHNRAKSYSPTFIDLSKFNKDEIKDGVLVQIHNAKSFGEINEVAV